jgi:2-oxo-3-hexenedioate decarboxylase
MMVDHAVPEILAMQQRTLDALLRSGRRLTGVKTSLLSHDAQRRLGAVAPVCGWLTSDMELPDGAELDCGSRPAIKAEPEVVFTLGADLVGPGVTEADVLRATAAISAGIELPGSARSAPPADIREFVEDNTSAANYIVGRPVPDFADLDLSLLGALVERDGEVISSGAGARVLGSPARSVAWVVNVLSQMRFELRAGMIVFTGAIADPVAVTAGHVISAEFAHLGRIGFTAV